MKPEPKLVDTPDDDLLAEAAKIVIRSGKATPSLLQKYLSIGYDRASRILEVLEDRNIVSSDESSGSRKVLSGEREPSYPVASAYFGKIVKLILITIMVILIGYLFVSGISLLASLPVGILLTIIIVLLVIR